MFSHDRWYIWVRLFGGRVRIVCHLAEFRGFGSVCQGGIAVRNRGQSEGNGPLWWVDRVLHTRTQSLLRHSILLVARSQSIHALYYYPVNPLRSTIQPPENPSGPSAVHSCIYSSSYIRAFFLIYENMELFVNASRRRDRVLRTCWKPHKPKD